ncbi:NAD(P)-dependent alcohol dehydrogenase, partial [Rhodococcus erythropolis]|nr:NAD(P)-dependent alcohol dehydrogenase [Rhodococcus erythropolis]
MTHTTVSGDSIDLPATIRANVLVETGKMQMVERPRPSPKTGEVLVRIHAVGVCGSDAHYFH